MTSPAHLKGLQYNNGCHNCKHLFLWNEYDEPARFYCTLRAKPRPLCCSVGMGESGMALHDDRKQNRIDREWKRWSTDNDIPNPLAAPFCIHWEKKS